ncbi:MAG: endonuclease III [Candidatus Micrarchaeota archaeon]
MANPQPEKGKILRIHKLLLKEYGKIKPWKKSPLDTLVAVILSQNTNDRNSFAAFEKLKKRFGNWNDLLKAPVSQITELIKIGGLADIKARRIKEVLIAIREKEGKLSLKRLEGMPPAEARNYLMQFKGIGPKSAAVIVAFAFGKPSFPIDTHIFRVIKRIPLIPENTSYENAHLLMDGMVPDALKIPLHMEIIEHGRKVCKSQSPFCGKCVLSGECGRVGISKSDAR